MREEYDHLKLDSQICFPLYACSKEIVRRYKPFLDPLGLTYTQYIVMMALWEQENMTVSELGKRLYLDSGTLTPLLKKMEARGYVTRARSGSDERSVIIGITDAGRELRAQAVDIPQQMGRCVSMSAEDAQQLYTLLYKILNNLS
jgi:MarR family transcriptional regulator, organic hydroperoxide resistance regulator